MAFENGLTSHCAHVENQWGQQLICFCAKLLDRLDKVCRHVITSALASVIVVVTVAALSVGLGAYAMFRVKPSPVVDLSLKAFGIPNHIVTQNQDAYDIAVSDYLQYLKTGRVQRRSVEFAHLPNKVSLGLEPHLDESVSSQFLEINVRRKRSAYEDNQYQYRRMQVVHMVYLANDGSDNIFNVDSIATVREFERQLVGLPNFSDFCYMENARCAPLSSLIDYLDSKMVDESQQSLDGAVRQALSMPFGVYFTDGRVSDTNIKSRFLRSDIQFGSPLQGYSSSTDRADEQKAKFNAFLETLLSFISRSSTREVHILYGGNEVFDYQVSQTFWNDLKLAIFAVVAIVILMLVLTSFSIWLSFCGLITIILSFPLAFFFYRVVFNVVNLGILNGVAAFVIIGIGVDDVFVFINTFRQAHSISSLSTRMLHTIKTAGKATFFTSFTTAAAFAANLSSSIPAVHDFGLFMTLIVTCCWLLVALMMPAFITLWYKWFMCCESACFGCCSCKCKINCVKQLPEDVASFFKSTSSSDQPTILNDSDVVLLDAQETGTIHSSGVFQAVGQHTNPSFDCDHDEELLPLDEEMLAENVGRDTRLQCNSRGYEDDPLLILEEELLLADNCRSRHRASPSVREGCSLIVQLQCLMYYYIAVPVVKARLFIIAGFAVLFVISVGFVSQLKPATKPPQLYRPDTNLQIWLDLMANYSSQGVSWRGSSDLSSVVVPVPPTVQPVSTRLTDSPPRATTTSAIIVSSLSVSTSTTSTSMPTNTTMVAAPTSATLASMFSSTPLASMSSSSIETYASSSLLHTSQLHTSLSSQSLIPRSTVQVSQSTVGSSSSVSQSLTGSSTSFVPKSSPAESDITRTSNAWTQPLTLPTEPSTSFAASRTTTSTASTEASLISTTVPRVNIPQHVPLERGITVYIMFGVKGIDKSNVTKDHVFSEKGKVIYDQSFSEYFEHFSVLQRNASVIADLCRICTIIGSNPQLVKANSGRCLPSHPDIDKLISGIEECNNVPRMDFYVNGKPQVGLYGAQYLKWITFSFESTTFKGMSSFTAYKQYQQWQQFLNDLRNTLDPNSPVRDFFQTAEFWKQVIMEIVAVSSAVYGLVLSMGICILAVAIFTGHLGLLAVTVSTLLGLIFFVVAIFYWAGWELGAIEAISLSILIGSSVDYCVHIVEGYILAGLNPPSGVAQDGSSLRQWRARVAVSHIGVSVLSSALTTLAAALPLTQAILLPFARFGQIVAINAAVSVVYALTLCIALLSAVAPSSFKSSVRSTFKAVVITALVVGGATLLLFAISRINGVHIPGPSGSDLFALN